MTHVTKSMKKSIVTLPAMPTARTRSQYLGLGGLDLQALGGGALVPGALTVITGGAGTGRTTAALTCAATNLADWQSVVFATVEDDPADVVRALADRGVRDTQLEFGARVAKVASVNDVATLMALVIATAFDNAAADPDEDLGRIAPQLLVVDDATALGVTRDTYSYGEVRQALVDLSADLSSGRFATQVLAQVGTPRQKIAAMAQLRTGKFTDAMCIGTVLTTRTAAALAGPARAGMTVEDATENDYQLTRRAALIVQTLGRDAAGSVKIHVVKSREGFTAKNAS